MLEWEGSIGFGNGIFFDMNIWSHIITWIFVMKKITISESEELSKKWERELVSNPNKKCHHPVKCKEYDNNKCFSTGDIICGICGEVLKTEADRK